MNEHDDVTIEADDSEAEEKAEQRVAKLRAGLKACQKEKQEHLNGWQRAKADYVNLLKRMKDESEASEQRGKVKAVETLLPAFDALERAKEHGEVPEGFMAIARQIESAFAALGLEAVGEIGEPFDPSLHEAFAQDTVDDGAKDGKVTAVLEKGWRISSIRLGTGNSTIIRPAKVRVACLRTQEHFASNK